MTQQDLTNNLLDIQCKAASLASKWSNKVKLGKWCDEQECAIILADWALDILCNHTVCGKIPVEKKSQINGIFQQESLSPSYYLLLPIPEDSILELWVNGVLVLTSVVEAPYYGFNYNMATLVNSYFNDVVMYNDNGTYNSVQEVPIGELVFYNINTACDELIEEVFINVYFPEPTGPTNPSEPTPIPEPDIQVYLTQPTPVEEPTPLLGPVITPGECLNPSDPCFTNCFTDEQICILIKKINKVLTYNCNCC